MYFNQEKENTNIDDEFKQQKKFNLDVIKNNFKKIKKPIIICTSLFLIIIVFLIISKLHNNKKEYSITLTGEENITIYEGDTYNEPGYVATDNFNNDLTSQVIVNNQVDINKCGEYQIIYSIMDSSVIRNVTVIEKPIGATSIYLKGDITIYLKVNEEYIEPGYQVIDTVDGNLIDKVEVNSNVNEKVAGIYKIIYSTVNSSGVTTSSVRTVIVMDSEVSLSLNNTEYTNKSIGINIHISDDYFDYLLLPNNNTISDIDYTYNVTENGEYKFIIYNKQGSSIEKSIQVTNINKTNPSGTCSGSSKDGKTEININAVDDIGISKYVINNTNYTTNKITINKEMDNANVTIYDLAGNNITISCKITKTTTQSSGNNSSSSSSSNNSSNSSTKKMSGYIIIGDSRMVGMESAIKSYKPDNVYIIAKTSMGYNWFVNTAIDSVNQILKNHPSEYFYIYSNLGINDFNYSYATKLNSLASNEWKNHKVVYISVNPCDGSSSSCNKITNDSINNLNQNQKIKLSGVYYCDTYNGIGVGNFGCASSGDCIHYNTNTYKKIYSYIINNCSF